MAEQDPICVEDVIAASVKIKDHIHKTQIMTNATIDALASTETSQRRLLFKCEHLQKIGAFKIRGATNALLQLEESHLANGVVTHSSGNHAQALALAARQLGVTAYVVMPTTCPQVKKDAVRGYGAIVTECEPTQQSREETASRISAETGAVFIHPYNNVHVMAGQGTQMLELLEQAAEIGSPLDAVLIPCGGGGMLSGCATVTRALSPETLVFGVEPSVANDAQESLRQGSIQPALPPTSCADGLLSSLGPLTFRMISKNVDAIFTVTERQIVDAMRLIWERMKQVVEPSGAVGLAAALYNEEFRALQGINTIGVILCGGNVQLDRAMDLFRKYQRLNVILLKTKSVPKDPYEEYFTEQGISPIFVPVLDHAMVNPDLLLAACQGISKYSGLIVTSQRSVEAIGTALTQMTDTNTILSMPIYTVGPATCKAIRNLGFTNVLGSESGNGDALATYIMNRRDPNDVRPLFFVVGDKRRDIITKRMQTSSIALEELIVYETVTASSFPDDFAAATRDVKIDWIVFFSPAGADVALEYLKMHANTTKIATIGPTTEEYLIKQWSVTPTIVAGKPEPESLCKALRGS